jgi:outer membrane protein TolC
MKTFRQSAGSLNEALMKALKHRPDYISQFYSIEVAKSSVTSARSGYMPNIRMATSWNWSNNEIDNFGFGRYTFGVNFSILVFDAFQTNERVQNQQVGLERARVRQKQLEQTIAGDIQQAFLALSAAEKEMEITERALKSFQLNYDSMSERFTVGASNALEKNTANNRLIGAKINRITALYNYLAAQYRLQFAMGTLDR